MNAGNTVLAVVLLAVTAMAAADAIAQSRGGAPGGGSRGSRDGQMSWDQRPGGEQRPAVQEDPVRLAEYRLELLHEDLRLTPEQQTAWKGFADKVLALAADLSRERGRIPATLQMNSMQRIDQSVDLARNRLTALEEIALAAKFLYGQLQPGQQAIADARLATTLPAVSAAATAGLAGPRNMPTPPK